MLVFVMPLMSPKVANSWEHACKLFERSIRSVCNQTSSNFRVIVVCNEKPQVEFSHPHITYIEVDLPPPALNIEAKTLDRGYKVLTGLIWSQKFKPSHVMFVDADDCVSKHLAHFVEQNSQCDGWFIKKGYIYKDGSRIIYLNRKNFQILCGSCNIIKYNLYDLQGGLSSNNSEFILNYYGGHHYILKHLLEAGVVIKPLPFVGAVYTVANGENYYNKTIDFLVPKEIIKRIISLKNYRILTKSICDKFGVYNINYHTRKSEENTHNKNVLHRENYLIK